MHKLHCVMSPLVFTSHFSTQNGSFFTSFIVDLPFVAPVCFLLGLSAPVVFTVERAIVFAVVMLSSMSFVYVASSCEGENVSSLRCHPRVKNSVLSFQLENWESHFRSHIDSFQGQSCKVNNCHLKPLHPFFVRIMSLLDCS